MQINDKKIQKTFFSDITRKKGSRKKKRKIALSPTRKCIRVFCVLSFLQNKCAKALIFKEISIKMRPENIVRYLHNAPLHNGNTVKKTLTRLLDNIIFNKRKQS